MGWSVCNEIAVGQVGATRVQHRAGNSHSRGQRHPRSLRQRPVTGAPQPLRRARGPRRRQRAAPPGPHERAPPAPVADNTGSEPSKREHPGWRSDCSARPRGVMLRTIHQSSISGCYPSLDYLLARRSYPRRASSLSPVGSAPVARPLACGRNLVATPLRRTGSQRLSPCPGPANRHPDSGPPPANWRRPRQLPPASRLDLPGPEAPRPKPATIPSCDANATRCGSPRTARCPARTPCPETPLTLPESSSPSGLPHPPTRTDGLCPPPARRCGPTGVPSLSQRQSAWSSGIFQFTGLSPELPRSSPATRLSSTVHPQAGVRHPQVIPRPTKMRRWAWPTLAGPLSARGRTRDFRRVGAQGARRQGVDHRRRRRHREREDSPARRVRRARARSSRRGARRPGVGGRRGPAVLDLEGGPQAASGRHPERRARRAARRRRAGPGRTCRSTAPTRAAGLRRWTEQPTAIGSGYSTRSRSVPRAGIGEAALVVLLDDVDAADQPSRVLLGFVASRLRDAAVVLVATYRDSGWGDGR